MTVMEWLDYTNLSVYYEEIKRELKSLLIYECQCNWCSMHLSISLSQRIKRKLVGKEGRCRCYERQRVNVLRKLKPLTHEVELSYTLRFVSLPDLDRLCQFGLR